MRRVLHLLLLLAVLWCGLDLSPAEAEVLGEFSTISGSHQASTDQKSTEDHERVHIFHGCHGHCCVAPALDPAPSLGSHTIAGVLLFMPPSLLMASRSQAPPVEPPSA